jgi:hypothetical protein
MCVKLGDHAHGSVQDGPVSFPCPCCGYLTFGGSPGSYEICEICFWEDDAVQLRWPDKPGGANRVSLIEAQQSFSNTGASEDRLKSYVRSATSRDHRDDDWRPVSRADDSFEEWPKQQEAWPSDLTALYWWRPSFWRANR